MRLKGTVINRNEKDLTTIRHAFKYYKVSFSPLYVANCAFN